MNKTLALIAALGLVVAAPVFAADEMTGEPTTKAEKVETKADAKVVKSEAKTAKDEMKADAKAKLSTSAGEKTEPAKEDEMQ
jgi:hypothetical protein